eukprot:CAMPEP_0179445186 /NCGR_PEP_ID=MMETSP0799-20121207/28640_1 /TAXON_ID=46947 /ORGANISM="Geminigera cryophila, Strain CCMP2564" /LENGTH=120 /DNA_ID=CAMNT_0021232993 /DNA_START=132 /DNA_END=494 /DNA_ORIENTATION=-
MKWEHRMERIWEKRFSSLSTENGANSEDSADSARSHGAGGRGGEATSVRHVPRNVAGRVSAVDEVAQLRRQMRVIEDVQRDLDARSDQHRTGILGEDVWLQQQLQHGESTGGRSAACVLQ